MTELSLQERYAPNNTCFGCGPANPKGLKVRSFPVGDTLTASWKPESHYEAFPGVLNGGIIGALLDCHSNWMAAWHLMNLRRLNHPPVTVTAEYFIKLLRPTPSNQLLEILAKVVESNDPKVTVEATLSASNKTCATCRGIFVAVKPEHPAYHRW